MITVAILTVSDSTHAGLREDVSGPAVREHCEANGWTVAATAIVSDDVESIQSQLVGWADNGVANVLLTTGGTGISARDNTPEATRPMLDRELSGVAEVMRARGVEQTPLAVLSRGVAGTRKACFIVNLPGSPKGAVFSLRAIEHLVPHVLKLLSGDTEHKPELSADAASGG